MSRLSGFLQRWTVFAAAVLIWQLLTAVADDPFFPTPWQILVQGSKTWFTVSGSGPALAETWFEDILPSIGRVLLGWSVAAAIGIGIGTALGRSRTGMDYAGPLFAFFRSLPSPALVPVFIMLFGIGNEMKVLLITFGCVWPILLNTVDGVRSVDAVKTDTARSFRTPRHHWVGMVVLPAALPKIFAGLRVSLAISVILMVVSELVGVTSGIGYQLGFAQQQVELTTMWSWIALLGAIGFGLNTALLAVERRVLRWQPTRAVQARGVEH